VSKSDLIAAQLSGQKIFAHSNLNSKKSFAVNHLLSGVLGFGISTEGGFVLVVFVVLEIPW
jgi:hypothetical protein